MKRSYLFIVCILLLASCDTFYIISLSDESPNLNISTQCGDVNLSMYNWQGESFNIDHNYKLNDTLSLYRDSLRVYFKNERYPVNFLKDGVGILENEQIDLIGESSIRTDIFINKQIMKGDTLKVYPNGYMYCKQQEVKLDSLILVMEEDLRAPSLFK